MPPAAMLSTFYLLMSSLVFGASVYETLVVHPSWSANAPQSFVPFGNAAPYKINLLRFWIPAAPLLLLSGLAVLGVSYSNGARSTPLMISVACTVIVVVWTLAYFRPAIIRFFEKGGGGKPTDEVRSDVRVWIALNYVRVLLAAVAWCDITAAIGMQR